LQSEEVSRAIAAAPGLAGTPTEKQSELQELLTEGVCTHDALSAVFNSINRQTLASLVRDLGRC
jgi:hypothetical protein